MDKLGTAEKLQALADHDGTPGNERAAALKALNFILAKYGITLDQLKSHKKQFRTFSFRNRHDKEILFQVVFKTLNVNEVHYHKVRDTITDNLKRKIGFSLTETEYIEVDMLYNIYRKAFDDEIKMLFTAFIVKHQIFGEDNKTSEGPEPPLEEVQKIRNMMRLIKDVKLPRAALRGDV